VKNALQKWNIKCAETLKNKGYSKESKVLIYANKENRKLSLYFTSNDKKTLIDTWDFCAFSGELGPKKITGDGQIPEGLYYINRYNPTSSYHLSLGINYPNAEDKTRIGKNINYGGDIFIHGNCVTIGCIPIEDSGIEQLYTYLLLMQKNKEKKVEVCIVPFHLSDENIKKHETKYDKATLQFWRWLQKKLTDLKMNFA